MKLVQNVRSKIYYMTMEVEFSVIVVGYYKALRISRKLATSVTVALTHV